MTPCISRASVLLVAVLAALGAFALLPATASASQSGTVTLSGYGGTTHVYSTANNDQVNSSFGAVAGGQSLFLSVYPADFYTTFRHIEVYLFSHGPMVPGTYTATQGFQSYYAEHGLVVQDGVDSVTDATGTFTINSIDTTSPWGLQFDVSWTSPLGSGHAVVTATAPPDTTPPTVVFSPSDTVVAETTGAGTTVDFASHVSATDDRDPNPQVTCTPSSGSYFAVGYNEVWCTATDNAGNTSYPRLLRVIVLAPDTTPPYFYYLPDYNVPATGPDGATISLYMLAYDDRGTATITCTVPPNGTQIVGSYATLKFPINAPGTSTTVNCVATDAAGNQTNGSFKVHVQGAGELTGALIAEIDGWNLDKLGTSLHDKLVIVQGALAAGKTAEALEDLDAFVSQVNAVKSGTKLPDWWWQSGEIKSKVGQIETVIGS
jgi:hypothetical protein